MPEKMIPLVKYVVYRSSNEAECVRLQGLLAAEFNGEISDELRPRPDKVAPVLVIRGACSVKRLDGLGDLPLVYEEMYQAHELLGVGKIRQAAEWFRVGCGHSFGQMLGSGISVSS